MKKSAPQLVYTGKEIAGFKEDVRMSEFSRGQLKVRMRSLGTCVGRYGPVDYC